SREARAPRRAARREFRWPVASARVGVRPVRLSAPLLSPPVLLILGLRPPFSGTPPLVIPSRLDRGGSRPSLLPQPPRFVLQCDIQRSAIVTGLRVSLLPE